MIDDNILTDRWELGCYNPPGLLVGPLPHVLRGLAYVPDFRYPGVAKRVRIGIDFVCDFDERRRR